MTEQEHTHLVVLTYNDYVQLKHALKEAGLDLCYMAQAGQPIRLDWSPDLFTDVKFVEQLVERRPDDPSYRIVSVWQAKQGGWFRPDEFIVTFHTVGALQQEALERYLTEHEVHGSATAPKEQLVRT